MSTDRPPVRKHLIDPSNPRPQGRYSVPIGRVQKWVLSTLAATTILHLAVGLVFAAAYADRLDAQIGLLVIASAFGVIAIIAALLIHQHRLLTGWLALGVLPGLVGAWLLFG